MYIDFNSNANINTYKSTTSQATMSSVATPSTNAMFIKAKIPKDVLNYYHAQIKKAAKTDKHRKQSDAELSASEAAYVNTKSEIANNILSALFFDNIITIQWHHDERYDEFQCIRPKYMNYKYSKYRDWHISKLHYCVLTNYTDEIEIDELAFEIESTWPIKLHRRFDFKDKHSQWLYPDEIIHITNIIRNGSIVRYYTKNGYYVTSNKYLVRIIE